MIDTLNIGKYIYSILKQIEGVDVNPLVADNETKFPFMVYKRTSLISSGCKDGYYEDKAIIEVVVVSDKYHKGVEIATKVRELLEVQHTTFEDMEINDTTLILASEDYSNNAFIQRMQFELTINKN